MKNLARHIELLLRDNDCVILPGFGGFIAQDIPAYYVSEEALYYPPSRSISFNAAISMNDGLLAQSYMRSYQVDYARATYMIDVAIEQLRDTLDEEGTVEIPHIGTISQDISQSLLFTPEKGGIDSPKHFGLGSFVIKELSLLQQPVAASQNPKGANNTRRSISVHINKDAFRHVMSTAAVILLLLMVALPTGNYRPTDIASLRLTEIIAAPQIFTYETEVTNPATIDTMTSEEAPKEESPQEATADIITTYSETATPETAHAAMSIDIQEGIYNATEQVVSTESEVTPPQSAPEAMMLTEMKPTKTYHIIVASLPNHRGADETLTQYRNSGYPTASLVERDDRVRISLMQFTDKNEANEQLKTLRNETRFQNAWLLAVKD